VKTCDDKNNSRFYAVIIQYTSRLQTQNLFKFVRGLIPGASRNHYHFRSAKPEDVAKLTMSEFNGVCPIGNKVDVPIILSARLLDIPTGFMWVGGGEPELKLGFPVQDFIKYTGCFVSDIAEDGLSMDDDSTKETEESSPATAEPEAQ
jgi:prolyl-tRNA editing enzyme YbaK/EbsC (Cys-tRNA(Pro) deacylase)